MCNVVVIDGREINTVGDLRTTFGCVVALGDCGIDDSRCLCAVDIPATLRQAGKRWREMTWETDYFIVEER